MNPQNPSAGTILASVRYPAFRWLLSEAATVADVLIARIIGGPPSAPYPGEMTCYIEMGEDTVGTVDATSCLGRHPPHFSPRRRSKGLRTNAASPPFAEIADSVQDPAKACQMARPPILATT